MHRKNILQKKTIEKIDKDFNGAKAKWPDLKEWYFLTKGTLIADIHKHFEELRKANPTIKIINKDHKGLLEWAENLNDRQICELLQIEFVEEGFYKVSQDHLERISKIYVPPKDYNTILSMLKKIHVVAIVGQPHVGKTATALFLAKEISQYTQIKNIYEVDLVDNVTRNPITQNSIIIMDDLFGDINFENIGKRISYISQLRRLNNYIIITSRDYIFKEARLKTKIEEEIPQLAPEIIQEGSYTTIQLEEILKKHIETAKETKRLNDQIEKNIYLNISFVLNELRFPHNLEIFVENCCMDTEGDFDLKNIVKISRKIDSYVLKIIDKLEREEQKILLLFALLRETDINHIVHLAEVVGIPTKLFFKSIKENQQLISVNVENRLRLKHPSFRQTILQYYEEHNPDLMNDLIFRLLKSLDHSIISIKSLNSQIQKVTKELEPKILASLFLQRDISVDINTSIFSSLLTLDPQLAVDTYLQADFKKYHLKSAKNNTSPKKMEEALKYIVDSLKSGEMVFSKKLGNLIQLLLIASPENTIDIYSLLNVKDYKEMKFKVALLLPICHKNPRYAFEEIQSLLRSGYNNLPKKTLYNILGEIRGGHVSYALSFLTDRIKIESDENIQKIIMKSIERLQQLNLSIGNTET